MTKFTNLTISFLSLNNQNAFGVAFCCGMVSPVFVQTISRKVQKAKGRTKYNTNKQTDRQTARQPDRHTDRHTANKITKQNKKEVKSNTAALTIYWVYNSATFTNKN